MAKVNFTAARIAVFKCLDGKSQTFLWDSRAPGLAIRATANGSKSFIFQGKIRGATVRVTIGDSLSWSIDNAQEKARTLQTLIDRGIDPREQAASDLAAHDARLMEMRRQDVTFGEAWENYLEARKARWSERHYKDHVGHADEGGKLKRRGKGLTVAGPLASLRPLKLSALTSHHITQWLDSEARRRPTMTALSFRLLRGFIRWADDIPEYRGIVAPNAYTSRSVKDAVPRTKARDGDSLQREQLPAWFDRVRSINNRVISAYLQALLITGARREEMLALRWVDVDFRWRSLSLADKVEKEAGRTIPLTPYLACLLSGLPRRNEWVFSSLSSESGHIEEPRVAHNQALAAAGLPHVSIHGLRRSFGTLAEWCEVPVGVVAQIQGHKPSAIAEKHYRRRPLDLLRKWHDTIEAWVLKEANVDFDNWHQGLGLHVVSDA